MMEWQEKLTAELQKVYAEYTAISSDNDWRLCASGLFSEVELCQAYSQSTGIPMFDDDDTVAPEQTFPNISTDYLNSNCCLPGQWDDETLQLLICDPYMINRHLVFFRQFYNLKCTFVMLRRSKLERLLADVYSSKSDIVKADDEESLRTLASEAKIVRLVNEMFSQAVERRASDIHVEPEEDVLIIRFRIDGVMHEYLSCPITQYPAIASRIKLVSNLNIAESRLPQDGRTKIQLARCDMDVRVSTIPTMNGESIVLRLLSKEAVSFDLGVVGMNETMRNSFEKLIRIPHGIILVVGPTGSGKSTTLYSVVSQLNDHKNKIITIEDPVEYKLPRLTQMQVNPAIGVTFASGLRSIVRQDPDIILIGEIRDRETADIAINAALTGHLVLSTLHTNDAAGAISRLLDMGVEHYLLASALSGVLSQRLVRKICSACRNTGITEHGGKCKSCGGTGFRGRTGIFELLVVNDEIRQAITHRLSSTEIEQMAITNGMIPLLSDGTAKAEQGITTLPEVKRAATEV